MPSSQPPSTISTATCRALRDLVRARHGTQPAADIQKKWTAQYLTWLNTHVHFEQPALEATLLDYVHEVHHTGERIVRLEKAIDEAIATAPEQIRCVIAALQALRGVAHR